MGDQLSLLDAPVAQVRKQDPRTAKRAAAASSVERAEQWKQLLRRLHDGPISADTAGRVIGKHRSIASSRLGVMVKRGLVEHGGEEYEAPADGGPERLVLRYRLTAAGHREHALMFGGDR
jgi:hypothetical protein